MGRSSGTGTELGLPGREMEASEDCGRTEELWDPELWVGVGQVWGVMGTGASILPGAMVPLLSCGLEMTIKFPGGILSSGRIWGREVEL